MKSIDERMINMIDNNLGMELSKTYVQKYFNDNYQRIREEMKAARPAT